MRIDQGRAAQSLVNVRTFLRNTPEVAELADTPAGKQLDAAIAGVTASVADQASARLDDAVHRQRIAELSRTLVQEYMKPAAQFARTSLRGSTTVADFAALGRVNRDRASKKLTAHARAMATAAAPVSAAFTAAKFDADFITRLGTTADELDAAIDARKTNTGRGVQATRGIGMAIKSGREAVSMLDAVVTRILKGDKRLAAWQSAKHVRQPASSPPVLVPPIAGPTPAPAHAPTAAPAPTPAPAPLVTPAAAVVTKPQEVKAS